MRRKRISSFPSPLKSMRVRENSGVLPVSYSKRSVNPLPPRLSAFSLPMVALIRAWRPSPLRSAGTKLAWLSNT